MVGTSAMLFSLAAILGAEPPALSAADFQRWFDVASEGKLDLSVETEARASHYRYVFVGGFQNESRPGYFAQNIKELRVHGIPNSLIHEVYPSSRKTVAESRDEIRAAFHTIAASGPQRLVIIAHSRGACDALAFALENPRFVRERVAWLFLVQGPFGGTPLADYVLGEGQKMDREMPLRSRVVGRVVGRLERTMVKRGAHAGLPGLTQDNSEQFWTEMLEEHDDAIPIIAPKTYYVTSQVEPGELGFVQASTGRYLEAYYGPNDSIVKLSDQTLPGVGTVLGPLEVGHTDLTTRFPATHAPRRYRKALVQCVMMAVARADKYEELARGREKTDEDVQAASLREEDFGSRRRGLFGKRRERR